MRESNHLTCLVFAPTPRSRRKSRAAWTSCAPCTRSSDSRSNSTSPPGQRSSWGTRPSGSKQRRWPPGPLFFPKSYDVIKVETLSPRHRQKREIWGSRLGLKLSDTKIQWVKLSDNVSLSPSVFCSGLNSSRGTTQREIIQLQSYTRLFHQHYLWLEGISLYGKWIKIREITTYVQVVKQLYVRIN